ncbi:hypothetical protein ACFYE8_18720 [Rhizobium leguminosarum]|uniref:hypothetical protein n=1 Tax=Rhizobium leguminosarum TaxID=384 RepID=UPI0036D94E79
MPDHFQRWAITIFAFWLSLVGGIEQAQAQFGASGTTDLPLFLVFGPWIILVVAPFGLRWIYPALWLRLCTAARRALIIYLFIEIVPIFVCLLLIAIFDVGRPAGLGFWVVSMMGVIFSGLVLLLLISVALSLDWVVYLWRREKQTS